jgi:hypothetical protein
LEYLIFDFLSDDTETPSVLLESWLFLRAKKAS